jgi:hypothetical protein
MWVLLVLLSLSSIILIFFSRLNLFLLKIIVLDDFKPQSVDASKPGLMTRSSTDQVFVDWQNQTGDLPPISFTGKFETGKDIDCVLVFDESADGSFVLEPMAGMVKRLTHNRLGGQAAAQRLATLPTEVEPESLPDIDDIICDSADDEQPILDMSGRPGKTAAVFHTAFLTAAVSGRLRRPRGKRRFVRG